MRPEDIAKGVGESVALFYEGLGQYDKKNYAKAVEIRTKAAGRPVVIPDIRYQLGICYEGGRGVRQDFKKAVGWYQKAAEQGNADAAKALDALRKGNEEMR